MTTVTVDQLSPRVLTAYAVGPGGLSCVPMKFAPPSSLCTSEVRWDLGGAFLHYLYSAPRVPPRCGPHPSLTTGMGCCCCDLDGRCCSSSVGQHQSTSTAGAVLPTNSSPKVLVVVVVVEKVGVLPSPNTLTSITTSLSCTTASGHLVCVVEPCRRMRSAAAHQHARCRPGVPGSIHTAFFSFLC